MRRSFLGEAFLAILLTVVAGYSRHVGPARQFLRPDLVADGVHRLRRGTDPDRAGRLDGPGEPGALREEAVAGMYRFGPRPFDGLYEPPDI